MNLSTIKTMLIDGDGVLWRGNDPLPGLTRFFDVLSRRAINWALVTNNSMRTVDAYLDKLRSFGISATPDQIFTSANVTAAVLQKRYPPGTPLYVIGAPGLKQTLTRAGFTVLDGEKRPDGEVPAVVVGLDTGLTYDMLSAATLLIRDGADFVATNPDRTIPSPQGILPGSGSILSALAAATDVEPEVIGKPQPAIFDEAMKHFKTQPSNTAMLGDRMETDILGAARCGIMTILILTGVTHREDLLHSDYQPDHIVEDITALADQLETP